MCFPLMVPRRVRCPGKLRVQHLYAIRMVRCFAVVIRCADGVHFCIMHSLIRCEWSKSVPRFGKCVVYFCEYFVWSRVLHSTPLAASCSVHMLVHFAINQHICTIASSVSGITNDNIITASSICMR